LAEIINILDYEGLGRLLINIANTYAAKAHEHTVADISDMPAVPQKLSDLINDTGFITADRNTTYELQVEAGTLTLTGSDGSFSKITLGDMIVMDSQLDGESNNPVANSTIVAALENKVDKTVTINGKTLEKDVMLTSEDIGAEAAGGVDSKIEVHNADTQAHADLRALIDQLTQRLNLIADSDDETLDQLSEIISYAKANEELIYAITDAKVSTEDIVDSLEDGASNQPLSARQGTVLKEMIDSLDEIVSEMEGNIENSLAGLESISNETIDEICSALVEESLSETDAEELMNKLK